MDTDTLFEFNTPIRSDKDRLDFLEKYLLYVYTGDGGFAHKLSLSATTSIWNPNLRRLLDAMIEAESIKLYANV